MPKREYEPNYRERIVEWVWQQLAAHYPAWSASMGPVWDEKRERKRKRNPDRNLWPKLSRPARVWADYLKQLDSSAIDRAVKACTQEGRTELPTLPEFLALCHQAPDALRTEPEQAETEQQKQQRLARGQRQLDRLLHSLRGGSTHV